MVTAPRVRLPLHTHLTMLGRLFAIQGAWNYEILLGNGVGLWDPLESTCRHASLSIL